jgi:hypothetical protein
MEDLIKNDASFEVFANSEGAELLENRTLMSYPSEKSSYQVFLGVDGEEKKPDEKKTKIDPEKLAQGVTATASAISSVGSTIQAFKGDGSKPKSRRKELKDVCGRKPLLKKNRATYDKCVADYNAGKIGNVMPNNQRTSETPTETPPAEQPNNTKKIVIGLVVVGVLVTAFIGYKKGWFAGKAK